MSIDKTFKIKWRGRGFGELLILAWVTQVLNDNDIPAVLHEKRRIKGLVDCATIDPLKPDRKKFTKYSADYTLTDGSMHYQHIRKFSKWLGKKITTTLKHIPVTFEEISGIPAVDVVMCTKSGTWSPYRDWPYFKELKKKFDRVGISYYDLNANKCYGHECLNYVKNCKLYLGLETGTSHYVSKFANGKALIIQSGFAYPDFWALPYDYEFISQPVDCSPCWLNKKDKANGQGCKFYHKCMKDIKSEIVFRKVIKWLKMTR